MKEFFEKKRSEGKHTLVATGAVARRMVHLIYSLWKDNRPFDPNYQCHHKLSLVPESLCGCQRTIKYLLTFHSSL